MSSRWRTTNRRKFVKGSEQAVPSEEGALREMKGPKEAPVFRDWCSGCGWPEDRCCCPKTIECLIELLAARVRRQRGGREE